MSTCQGDTFTNKNKLINTFKSSQFGFGDSFNAKNLIHMQV